MDVDAEMDSRIHIQSTEDKGTQTNPLDYLALVINSKFADEEHKSRPSFEHLDPPPSWFDMIGILMDDGQREKLLHQFTNNVHSFIDMVRKTILLTWASVGAHGNLEIFSKEAEFLRKVQQKADEIERLTKDGYILWGSVWSDEIKQIPLRSRKLEVIEKYGRTGSKYEEDNFVDSVVQLKRFDDLGHVDWNKIRRQNTKRKDSDTDNCEMISNRISGQHNEINTDHKVSNDITSFEINNMDDDTLDDFLKHSSNHVDNLAELHNLESIVTDRGPVQPNFSHSNLNETNPSDHCHLKNGKQTDGYFRENNRCPPPQSSSLASQEMINSNGKTVPRGAGMETDTEMSSNPISEREKRAKEELRLRIRKELKKLRDRGDDTDSPYVSLRRLSFYRDQSTSRRNGNNIDLVKQLADLIDRPFAFTRERCTALLNESTSALLECIIKSRECTHSDCKYIVADYKTPNFVPHWVKIHDTVSKNRLDGSRLRLISFGDFLKKRLEYFGY